VSHNPSTLSKIPAVLENFMKCGDSLENPIPKTCSSIGFSTHFFANKATSWSNKLDSILYQLLVFIDRVIIGSFHSCCPVNVIIKQMRSPITLSNMRIMIENSIMYQSEISCFRRHFQQQGIREQ
jgi:hypothetical protein